MALLAISYWAFSWHSLQANFSALGHLASSTPPLLVTSGRFQRMPHRVQASAFVMQTARTLHLPQFWGLFSILPWFRQGLLMKAKVMIPPPGFLDRKNLRPSVSHVDIWKSVLIS